MESVIAIEQDRSAWEARLSRRATTDLRGAFLEGDGEAVHEVQALVRGIVHGGWRFADADAVVQEILLELLRLVRSGEVRRELDFRAYVRTVTRHSCVDAFRRERLRETQALEDHFFELPGGAEGDPEQRYEELCRRERLRFLWQGLAPACRELLRWAYGEDLTSPEIAGRLGISAGTARVRLHRCLERARELHRESIR